MDGEHCPEDWIINMVRLALACEVSKRPVKREDILSHVLGEVNGKFVKTLIRETNARLKKDYGMHLVPLPTITRAPSTLTVAGRRAATKKAEEAQPTNPTSYILVASDSKISSFHPYPDNLALLATILVLIQLSGGEIEESHLLERLSEWSVDGHFVNIGELFIEFKKQKYLIVGKKNDDMNVTVYSAGPRSTVEFPPSALVDFVMELGQFVQQTHKLQERLRTSFRLDERGDLLEGC